MEILFDFEKKRNLKNREIFISYKGVFINDSTILKKYCSNEKIKKACEYGCVNYGKKWSCPPYAENFSELSEQYQKAIILLFSTKTKYYLDIKNKYTAMKAANITLKTLIEKCARGVESSVNGYSLLSGSCRLCKKCACKTKEKCRKPKIMRYSMEATMLDVSALCENLMGVKLLWYENKVLPEYTCTVSMILFNDDIKKDK